MGGPIEEQHTVEDVGWLHHIWDEVGPELVTGLFLLAAAGLGIWYKIRRNKK